MFDLSTLALADTTEVTLRHPVTQEALTTDKGEAVTVTVFGTSSKQYRNAVTAMQNRQLRRNQRKEPANADVMREEAIELLVACSASSKNLSLDGKAVTSAEDFRKLYANPSYSWLREQIDEALGNTANFLPQ